MKIPSNFSDLLVKIFKVKEIGLVYLSRYFDWHRVPEPETSFFASLRSDKSAISKLLFKGIDKEKVIHDADRICSGEMKLYEVSLPIFKGDLNWHKDYYSNHIWSLKPFFQIYYPNNEGIDLNVPWELSRMQFIPTLIQAFKITSDSKYITRLTDLIDSWIGGNPYCFGINWRSCMEVGLRAVNIVLAIAFLEKNISNQKLKFYFRILWKHALYIYKYDVVLDRVQNKNNHYLASMLGLQVVSLCFNGLKAKKFRDHVLSSLGKEIHRQFNEDGGNFESATGYHQFSLEVVMVSLLLLRVYHNNDVSKDFVKTLFGKGIRERLVKALDLVWDYMSCYGESPHIGDSSDCRVIVFRDYFSREASDHSFLFRLGELALNYRVSEKQDRIAKLWPKSGYAFFKNRHYGIVAFGGPKGTDGGGGHGHNDKCSFLLQVGGQPIFVDSGTYIYNAKSHERYKIKRGKAHNIIKIDNEEQCLIEPEIVFGLIGEINTEIKMAENDGMVNIKMQHDGYRRVNELGIVSREIICEERSLEINDKVHGSGTHNISIFFNLHPSITGKSLNNTINITSGSVNIILILPRYFQLYSEESFYSDSYHVKTRNIRIIASAKLNLPSSWKTKIGISYNNIT